MSSTVFHHLIPVGSRAAKRFLALYTTRLVAGIFGAVFMPILLK